MLHINIIDFFPVSSVCNEQTRRKSAIKMYLTATDTFKQLRYNCQFGSLP